MDASEQALFSVFRRWKAIHLDANFYDLQTWVRCVAGMSIFSLLPEPKMVDLIQEMFEIDDPEEIYGLFESSESIP
jgi:hypothetical protein